MAKKGLAYVVAGLYKEEGGKVVYEKSKHLGPATSFAPVPTVNNVKDYGDNGVSEEDSSITEVALTFEINDADLETEAMLFGYEIEEETGELVVTDAAVPPYIGMGAIGDHLRGNKNIYRAIILSKAKLQSPGDNYETKKEQVTFSHVNVSGTGYKPLTGKIIRKKEFDTFEEAKAYINEIFGIENEETA